MTYRANTIAAANVMTLFLQNIESDMTNVGWVNVASQIAANFTSNAANTTTNTQILVDVFKSPAGNNSIANDWYVYLATDQATNTYLFVSFSAAFNSSTNLVSQYALPNTTTATMNVYANQFCTNANTTNLYLTSTTVGAGTICSNGSNARIFTLNTMSMLTTGNGTNYYYSVTIDRLIMSVANNVTATTLNSNGSTFYVGAYDSFMPLTVDPYPLILANISQAVLDGSVTNYQGMALTEPAMLANNIPFQGFISNFLLYINYAWNIFPTAIDKYQAGNPTITRIPVGGQGGSGGFFVGYRGMLKDVFASTTQFGKGDLAFFTFNGAQQNLTCIGNGSAIYNSVIGYYAPLLLQV